MFSFWILASIRKWLFLVALLAVSLSAQAGSTTNSIGITLVDIPTGNFLMGSCKLTSDMRKENERRSTLGQDLLSINCNNDQEASDIETPQHRVSIKSFQMGKTEVTLGQFKRFLTATKNDSLISEDFKKYNNSGDNAPVVYVSWNDAQAFIDWLNKVEGGSYRLPSESEWEYACRAGSNQTYCGANDANSVAWYSGNSGNHPHAAGELKPNTWGLHDMSGNVYEWIQDCWHDSYRGASNDGSPWTSGKCSGRVLRGGSWDFDASDSRSASRSFISPEYRYYLYGFRVARSSGR
jgi:formylglycine-generating enzyme required for sulfatase activity